MESIQTNVYMISDIIDIERCYLHAFTHNIDIYLHTFTFVLKIKKYKRPTIIIGHV